MACTGHCNQCAAHPGYVGPVSTTWTDDPLIRGIFIKETHWDELRDAIDAETSRRSDTWSGATDPGNVSVGDSVHSKYDDLRDQVVYLGETTNQTTVDPLLDNGYPVSASSTSSIRNSTSALEAVCICDCNYACTCDCNYPCTCNCAHSCLCNCNYSGSK